MTQKILALSITNFFPSALALGVARGVGGDFSVCGSCTAHCSFGSSLTINDHVLLLVHTCFLVAHVRHVTSSLLTYPITFFVCLFTCSRSSSTLHHHFLHTTLLRYKALFFILNHLYFYHRILLPTLIHTHRRCLNSLSVSLSRRHHIVTTSSSEERALPRRSIFSTHYFRSCLFCRQSFHDGAPVQP